MNNAAIIDPDLKYGLDFTHIRFTPDCEPELVRGDVIRSGDIYLWFVERGTYAIWGNSSRQFVRGEELLKDGFVKFP